METDFKKEIVLNLRGFFLTQIISTLVKNNSIKIILEKEKFYLNDFKLIKNKKNLSYLFNYLSNIGYFKNEDNFYSLTEIGRDVLMRYSSFLVPHSYNNYLLNLDKLLLKKKNNLKIDRDENILGSGKTHMRYFFTALNYLKKKNKFKSLIDIGIGNGDFAIIANQMLSLNKICGVDLSTRSVKTSKKKLAKLKIKNLIIKNDASKIQNWSKKIHNFNLENNLLISMWFLIQEISLGIKSNVTNYLNSIKRSFPKAKIILCELIRTKSEIYSSNKDFSFMPEYMFFHDLSGQKVFEYEALEGIIKNSNLKIEKKFIFDKLIYKKKIIPSCVIYILK